MNKRRSQSGPVRIIRRNPPITISPEQQAAVDSSRRAIYAAKQDEKDAYEQLLKLKGLRRL